MAPILPGTLDMLILRTLIVERMHGYAIAQHIARVSNNLRRPSRDPRDAAQPRRRTAAWVASLHRVDPLVALRSE